MTELLYLHNTYLFQYCWVKVIEIWENDFWKYIILDKTIFYPQGWWQESDRWFINSKNWIFEVYKTVLEQDWIVYHYWEFKNCELKNWDIVDLEIDKDFRIQNSKNHSAGHFLEIVINNIMKLNLKPSKWYHFQNWPYVEYSWNSNISLEELKEKLQENINLYIEKDIKIKVDYEKTWVESPNWKKPRYVYFDWYNWCGCWWTHISSTKELWNINIKKIKNKKWIIKVSYEVL